MAASKDQKEKYRSQPQSYVILGMYNMLMMFSVHINPMMHVAFRGHVVLNQLEGKKSQSSEFIKGLLKQPLKE